MNIITYASGDNWEGVYVNGILYHEDHRVTGEDMAIILHKNQPFASFTRQDVDYYWMDDVGQFPTNLNDVKFAE